MIFRLRNTNLKISRDTVIFSFLAGHFNFYSIRSHLFLSTNGEEGWHMAMSTHIYSKPKLMSDPPHYQKMLLALGSQKRNGKIQ